MNTQTQTAEHKLDASQTLHNAAVDPLPKKKTTTKLFAMLENDADNSICMISAPSYAELRRMITAQITNKVRVTTIIRGREIPFKLKTEIGFWK